MNSRLLSQITAQSITTTIQRLKTRFQIRSRLLLSSVQLLSQAAAGCSQLGELSCESSSLCPLVSYGFLSLCVPGPVPLYVPSAAVGLLKACYEVRMCSLEVLHPFPESQKYLARSGDAAFLSCGPMGILLGSKYLITAVQLFKCWHSRSGCTSGALCCWDQDLALWVSLLLH